MRLAISGILIAIFAFVATGSANASADTSTTAEIFATNNMAVITAPNDPRLHTLLLRFASEVREIIRGGGGQPGSSALLNGVFWSAELHKLTYERSREFDERGLSADGLHQVTELIRKQYHQESVLTFQQLARSSPRVNAIEVKVPHVDVQRLHDALAADAWAQDRLGGGSVTVSASTLILVADLADYSLVRQFIAERLGNEQSMSIHYGVREFVE